MYNDSKPWEISSSRINERNSYQSCCLMRGLEVYFGMLLQGFHRRRLGNTEVMHLNCCKRNGNRFLIQGQSPSPRDSNSPCSLGSCVLLDWGKPVSWAETYLALKYYIFPGYIIMTKINVVEMTLTNRRSKNQELMDSKQLSWICSTRNPSSSIFENSKNKNTKSLMSNKRIYVENLVLLTFKRILFLLWQ